MARPWIRPSKKILVSSLNQKLSITEIADQLHCSVGSISNWCRQYGIKRSKVETIEVRLLKAKERYGVTSLSDIPGSKENCTLTWQSKSPNQIKEITKKREKTLLDRYGVTNPRLMDDHNEKVRKTSLRNWGVENPMWHPDVLKRAIGLNKIEPSELNSISFESLENFLELIHD